MKPLSVIIQMKATEQYFPVVLFIILYKVVLIFDSVNKTLKRGYSNESLSLWVTFESKKVEVNLTVT